MVTIKEYILGMSVVSLCLVMILVGITLAEQKQGKKSSAVSFSLPVNEATSLPQEENDSVSARVQITETDSLPLRLRVVK